MFSMGTDFQAPLLTPSLLGLGGKAVLVLSSFKGIFIWPFLFAAAADEATRSFKSFFKRNGFVSIPVIVIILSYLFALICNTSH